MIMFKIFFQEKNHRLHSAFALPYSSMESTIPALKEKKVLKLNKYFQKDV